MPSSGFHIMTKPVGPLCNLDCAYCFYLEKENLYSGTQTLDDARRSAGALHRAIHCGAAGR